MSEQLNQPIKLVIVDDHAIVRQGIASYLSTVPNISIVGQADSSDMLFEHLDAWQPDVVLMDLQLTNTHDGILATETLKKRTPACQVVILTSFHQDDYIVQSFKAGALSYILKDIAPDELASIVIKAAKGDAVLSPLVATKLLSLTSSQPADTSLDLSNREVEVLNLVALGLNNAEIAEKLFINIKTVRTHVSSILNKLQLRDRTQVAIHAWRTGMVQQPSD